MRRARLYGIGEDLGRGEQATTDMKRRIAALREGGADVLDALWRRHLAAVHGEGYQYEFAEREAAAAAQ